MRVGRNTALPVFHHIIIVVANRSGVASCRAKSAGRLLVITMARLVHNIVILYALGIAKGGAHDAFREGGPAAIGTFSCFAALGTEVNDA